jgi:hypothetical protein
VATVAQLVRARPQWLVLLTSLGCAEPESEHPCGDAGEGVQIITCERGARALAVDGASVYWVSGWGGHLVTPDCSTNLCGVPAVYEIPHEGGEPTVLAELEHTPRSIARGPTVVVSSHDGLWEVGYRGGLNRLETGHPAFSVRGGMLFWASRQDPTLRRRHLPSTVASDSRVVIGWHEPVWAVAATDDLLVWASVGWDETGNPTPGTIAAHRLDVDEDDPFVVVDGSSLVSDLAIEGRIVVWFDASGLAWSKDLATDAPARRLAEDVTAIAVDEGYLYYGTFRPEIGRGVSGLHRVPLSGGEPHTLVEHLHEEGFDGSRLVHAIAVHGDDVYWSDARIMRKRLD